MVYVVRAEGTGLCKVGRSSCVPRRIKELQTSSPFVLKLVLAFCHQSISDVYLERHVHSELALRNCSGEWFSLSDDDVSRIALIMKNSGYAVIYRIEQLVSDGVPRCSDCGGRINNGYRKNKFGRIMLTRECSECGEWSVIGDSGYRL